MLRNLAPGRRSGFKRCLEYDRPTKSGSARPEADVSECRLVGGWLHQSCKLYATPAASTRPSQKGIYDRSRMAVASGGGIPLRVASGPSLWHPGLGGTCRDHWRLCGCVQSGWWPIGIHHFDHGRGLRLGARWRRLGCGQLATASFDQTAEPGPSQPREPLTATIGRSQVSAPRLAVGNGDAQ